MTLQVTTFSKQDFINRVFRRSDSANSERVAKTALKMFDLFCQSEGLIESQLIERYQVLVKEGNIRSICLSLDKFVQFLGKDHDNIILNEELIPTTFKKKNPQTIRMYFSMVKSYLRLCHAVKLSSEDIKDYIQFPKRRKEPRKAISLKTLKLILNHASPLRRALYDLLISSGLRLGEALALEVRDFHFDENPVRIAVRAETTKTKEGRETYISSETVDKIKPLIEGKTQNDRIFTERDSIDKAVSYEDQMFANLRERLARLDKNKQSIFQERYPDSTRYIVNIHSFRAYFHTKASQKHGSDYANALDGHGAYLKQYYRETPEERAKKYKELEPDLLIESVKLEAEKTKDKIIESLQLDMKKLQDKMTRIELLNKKD